MGIFDSFKKKKVEEKEEKLKIKAKEKITEYAPLKTKAEAAELKPKKATEAKKIKKEETKEAYRILSKPLVTEKATDLVSQNKYSFVVAQKANKIEIKK